MTLREAIERADALKPNAVPRHEKLRWLSELDGRIAEELIGTHEGARETFLPYTIETDGNTPLLAPFPYDDVYVFWLHARTDLADREIPGYNNGVQLFNARYAEFAAWYNRTHRPLGTRIRYFGEGALP